MKKKILVLTACIQCRHHKDYTEWSNACCHPEILKEKDNPNGRPMSVRDALLGFPKFCPLENFDHTKSIDCDLCGNYGSTWCLKCYRGG